MRLNKFMILLLTLFVSFGFINRVGAMTLKEFESYPESERESIYNSLNNEERKELLDDMMNSNISDSILNFDKDKFNTLPEEIIGGQNSNNNNNLHDNSSSVTSSGSWCTKFNIVWYVAGIIMKVIYVLVPLVLIVTGSITFIQAMMKDKTDNLAKASSLLIKKIVISLVIFLLVPITELCIGLVADEGWKTCADCFFSTNKSCKNVDITTGEG